MLVELRLVVPQIKLRGRTVHVQVDQALGLRRKMRQPGQRWLHQRGGTAGKLLAQHAGQRHATHAQAGLAKELPAGLAAVVFEKRIHE